MIEELLRRFIAGPWTTKLDFSTLEQVPAHYVSRFLEPRESDVVWRVRYGPKENDWLFVYVLMETLCVLSAALGAGVVSSLAPSGGEGRGREFYPIG